MSFYEDAVTVALTPASKKVVAIVYIYIKIQHIKR
jgi:hypothetical protein